MRPSINRKLGILAVVVLTCGFGAGCGDNENVDIDLDGPTATPQGGRTPTPIRTATGGARTATAGAATATAGAVTATPAGVTATPTPGGGGAAEVEAAVNDLLPFFTIASLTQGVGGSASTQTTGERAPGATKSADAVEVDDCPDGGTRTNDEGIPVRTITLADCQFEHPQLGSFEFDGTIVINILSGSVAVDVTTTDLNNANRMVDFSGSVTGVPRTGGGFILDGGPITITTPQGDFELTLDNIEVDDTGDVLAGAGTVEDTDDNFDLLKIDLTIRTGGVLADLVATFDDNSTAEFVLNLDTGDLTPA